MEGSAETVAAALMPTLTAVNSFFLTIPLLRALVGWLSFQHLASAGLLVKTV
jgi:hypothetical protein